MSHLADKLHLNMYTIEVFTPKKEGVI